jgi:hypothetical protein
VQPKKPRFLPTRITLPDDRNTVPGRSRPAGFYARFFGYQSDVQAEIVATKFQNRGTVGKRFEGEGDGGFHSLTGMHSPPMQIPAAEKRAGFNS